MEVKLEEGKHLLSAGGDINLENEYGDEMSGVAFIIDDNVWVAYEDPADGYRSYGKFEPYTGDAKQLEGLITFPEQEVNLEFKEEDYFEGIALTNIKNGKEILNVGTDYSDSYYPYCHFEWIPENLPINQGW